MIVLIALACFVLSALITRRLLDPNSRLAVLDHPNHRSLHQDPTPRGGGIAIAVASAAGGAVAFVVNGGAGIAGWLAVAGAMIFAVSFADDRAPVNPLYRLGVHGLAAAAMLLGGFAPVALLLPGLVWAWQSSLAMGFTVLFAVWFINLYNFMDGMDGFAAGMAVFGFGAFAWIGWQADHETFGLVCAAIGAASGGFLVFNFPPARIFMGDVGSSLLGFLAAAMMLWADRDGVFPLWVGVLVFSPFAVDATVTLGMRVRHGERIWHAHRTHFYQRLVRSGWGHRRTVLWEYVLMALCALSGAVAVHLPVTGQWVLLCAWVLAYTSLMVFVHGVENGAKAQP